VLGHGFDQRAGGVELGILQGHLAPGDRWRIRAGGTTTTARRLTDLLDEAGVDQAVEVLPDAVLVAAEDGVECGDRDRTLLDERTQHPQCGRAGPVGAHREGADRVRAGHGCHCSGIFSMALCNKGEGADVQLLRL
jgi:hypothetical protein